jgi:hypothetical protein
MDKIDLSPKENPERIYNRYKYTMMTTNILREMTVAKRTAKRQDTDYDDCDDFIRNCYVNLTPQSYGSKIEKRVRNKNGMTKVKSTLGKGDGIDSDGNYKEIKSSISDCNCFNVVQIRPYQDFYSYLLFFFNITEDGNVEKYMFEVPKNELMMLKGINGAHGTKDSNSGNKNIEYRLTINIGDENWNLLINKYTIKKEF